MQKARRQGVDFDVVGIAVGTGAIADVPHVACRAGRWRRKRPSFRGKIAGWVGRAVRSASGPSRHGHPNRKWQQSPVADIEAPNSDEIKRFQAIRKIVRAKH